MSNPLSLTKLLLRSVSLGRPTSPARRLALTTLEARITPAIHTWDNGGATNNWSDAGNWDAVGVPTTGESGGTIVVIPLNDPTINQDIVGLVIGQLQFTNSSSATLTVVTPLGIDGGGATNNVVNTSGTNTITGSSLNLTGTTAFVSVAAGSTLLVSSQLTGPQGFRKLGTGTMTLSGGVANTYAGTTTVADGLLVLNTNTADAGLSKTVVVGDGSGAAGSAALQLLGNNEIPDLASVTVHGDGQLTVTPGAAEDITALTLDGGAVSIAAGASFTIRSGGSVTTVAAAVASTISGPGTLRLTGPVTVTVPDGAAATDLLISAVVGEASVASGFVKAGAGTLELAGTAANTYTGATTINDGVLALNNNAVNGAVGLNLVVGDGVGAAGSAVVRLLQVNEIPNATAVTVHSDGRFDLNGFTDAVGLLTLDNAASVTTGAGTLSLSANVVVTGVGPDAPADITGLVNLGSAPRTVTVADGATAVEAIIDAVISGAGGLIKAGPGFLGLTGTNTYTGATVVNAGALEVAGVQSASAVTLTGGTLGGSGTVGPLTATGGILAPGVGLATTPRTFSTGNLSLLAGTYAPLVVGTAGGAADLVAVTGTVNLTGSTLTPTRTGVPITVGKALVILSNDGIDAVVGTFAGLPQGATVAVNGQLFAVSYAGGDGNDVTLTALNSAPTVTDVPNQPATANGVPVGPLAFTVGDAETAPAALVVTASSSNPAFAVVLGGAGSTRTVTVTPAAGQSGTATVTLTVTDAGGLTATDTFTVTVNPPASALVGAALFAVGTDAGSGGTATLYNADKSVRFAVTPFGVDFTGGVRVAAGDFNGDGVADLVVGTGPGRATRVIVLDGTTQAVLFTVDPFEASFTGGVYVAAGDLNGDGLADLVITPDEGGGPRVRVFAGNKTAAAFVQYADFFGIDDKAFFGGARAAVADISGDGVGDLVVAAGFGGGPRVAAFNGLTLAAAAPVKLFGDFLAFEPGLRNGAFVTAGDLNGDGFAELIAGGGPGGGPRVTAFDGKSLQLGSGPVPVANFFAGDTASRGGVRVAVKNLDGDTRADLLVGAGSAAGSRVTAYAGTAITPAGTPPELFAFDAVAGFAGGVFVG